MKERIRKQLKTGIILYTFCLYLIGNHYNSYVFEYVGGITFIALMLLWKIR